MRLSIEDTTSATRLVSDDVTLHREAPASLEFSEVRSAEGPRRCAGVMGDEGKLTRIMKRAGVGRVELDAVGAGDIASVAGMPTAGIADTIAAVAAKEGLDPGTIEPPTMRCPAMVCCRD